MKRFLVLFLALVLAVSTVSACEERVTLCHNGHTITVGWNAAYGPAGHLFENGHPRPGHEGDTLGPCPEPTVVPTEPPVEPPVVPTELPVVPTVDDPEQFLFNLQWDGDPSIPFAQLCYLDGSGCLGPVMASELATINGSVFAQVDFILVDWYDPLLLAAFYDGQPLDGWYRAGYGSWEYRDF